ncbi:MAG TPA: type II secretion system protein GspJ [Fimbriimonas sp.]
MTFRRGFTLVELLVVIGITGIVTMAATRAYIEGITFDERVRSGRAEAAEIRLFEERITELLRGAYVTTLPDDTSSAFIGDMGQGETGGSGGTANTLTFTTFGGRLSTRFLSAPVDEDFETLNDRFGPQGGLAEVSLSLTPVGQPSVDEDGLYLRIQRPADGDPTQGGYEELLAPGITDVTFEFFNGLAWQENWDTRTMTTRRLPSAVRMIYEREDEPTRVVVVRLPHSDATPNNPVGEVE